MKLMRSVEVCGPVARGKGSTSSCGTFLVAWLHAGTFDRLFGVVVASMRTWPHVAVVDCLRCCISVSEVSVDALLGRRLHVAVFVAATVAALKHRNLSRVDFVAAVFLEIANGIRLRC